ncbi:hypothetical protein acdb102_41930 [Acidothermaceae bacterium B102]|nr:hypothetical protein acdb102_41930 [Acidothermaceae bacterium B102]
MAMHTKRWFRSSRLVVAAATLVAPMALALPASAASPTSFHVNFGAQTTAAYPGYVLDYGLAYTDATGMGWEAAADGTALSLVGNGRERNLAASPDKRYDTQMQMQETAASTGVKTPGQWEHAIANGTYQVTVAVGDASAINSVNRITAEPGSANAVVIINNFTPTTGNFFSTVTSTVTVSDGKLTLSPTGGTNTKIDFVDVVPAAGTDTTAPSASVSLAGTLVSGTTYSGTVTATVNAADEVGGSGLKTTTYTIDNGPSVSYTAPFPVTASGSHTIVVTATDNAGNIGTATSTFSIAVPQVDGTAPTATIALAGTVVSGSTYQGTVTATVSSADEAGGSGLKTTTYSLDSGAATAYTTPISITAVGSHTLSVTATDNAGNVGNATSSFTIQAVSSGGPTSFHVNFGAQTTAAISGYSLDYGLAYTSATGMGWEAAADGTPLSLVGNGRERNLAASPDKRYDTLMQMQETASSSGVKTPGQWEHALANGNYAVTVAVGDDSAINSVYRITAEPGSANAVVMVNNVVPTASSYFTTVTKQVTVSDGRLTLSPTGGTNTKIDFVDVVPVGPTVPPTASISLSGTLVSPGVYQGTVTATVTAADVSGPGLSSTTYTLDGGTATPYTAPFTVTGNASHTIVATATDLAGNVGTATSTFTIQAPAPDTTAPTASISLAGTAVSAGVYQGNVTATITAADEAGGSGLATTTYALDGGSDTPYTAPFAVTGIGSHTISVTATDNANNTYTTTSTFTIQATPDTTKPTASISLAGTLYTPGNYTGTVTATVTSADEVGGSGLATTTYALDGGSDTPYTAPFPISDVGSHTISVTATDNANNTYTTTSTFTIAATDTTNPTASVSLAGTVVTPGNYTGTVTATIAPADEVGGSGVQSTSYTLDGGAVTPYTAPFPVTGLGSHTIAVTVTDNANNVGTATSTFTIQTPPDTTKPTASISLAGTVVSAGVYQGTVTATVTSADEVGGSGLASTTYTLDGGAVTPYTAPFPVTGNSSHTIVVTATDNANNTFTTTSTFTIQAAPTDTTPPKASISLAGTLFSPGNYQGTVTATVTASDETGGSGLASTTYTLDGGAPTAYTTPIQVTALGSHTVSVTAIDNATNSFTTSSTFVIQPSGAAKLGVVSPDDAVTANPSTPRLVFSAVRGDALGTPKAFTFTNTGTGPLLVSNLAIGGTNANNWRLATGQATSVTINPGASAQISIQFAPTDPTGCASTASPYAIGDVDRFATLTYTTNDPAVATGSDLLSGVNSCYAGGNSEPVLDQLLPILGYTTVVDTQYIDHRYIGPLRYLQGTDEIQSPYFTVATAGQPVSVVPLAHYGSPNTASNYQATGYYAAGSTMKAPNSTCNTACKTLWQFPPDSTVAGATVYNQDQKLLPTPTGVTTFTPTGTFGLFSGDFSDVNFSDDGLNTAHTTSNVNMPVPHYLHDMRVFPAYGPGHVAIPNTYIVGIDLSRVPSYKNNDFQDVILLVRNVQPAVSQATVLTATNDIVDLTKGGTVTATCGVTGFDGVLANTGGTQCNAANIGFTTSGLQLTSTAGQLANSNQQNALYKTFDATRGAFTIDAQVVGPVTQLTTNYQQIGAFFGPDQSNFIKVEAEHNGTGDPHLTMFYDVKGVSGTVATVAVPALTTATTLDLIIKGNTNVPDPLPYGDTYGVHGFPLDELTVYYSINGATPVQIGTTTEFPADVTTWFSRAAKAGILNSNTGTTTSITTTFSKFSITAP